MNCILPEASMGSASVPLGEHLSSSTAHTWLSLTSEETHPDRHPSGPHGPTSGSEITFVGGNRAQEMRPWLLTKPTLHTSDFLPRKKASPFSLGFSLPSVKCECDHGHSQGRRDQSGMHVEPGTQGTQSWYCLFWYFFTC